MGGDGGVIATKRAYFVKVKKAKEKRDPYEVAAQRWNTCALTNQRLRHPVRRACCFPPCCRVLPTDNAVVALGGTACGARVPSQPAVFGCHQCRVSVHTPTDSRVCVVPPSSPPSQIVADYLGLLYNKDSVIAHLLSKKKFPKHLRHIKGLKVRGVQAVVAPVRLRDPSSCRRVPHTCSPAATCLAEPDQHQALAQPSQGSRGHGGGRGARRDG